MQKIKRVSEPNSSPKLNALDFQKKAVEEIRDLEYAAIFHEQGLGKTKMAIDLSLYWLERKQVDTILLVTKKGLIKNWEKELKLHTHITPKVLGENKKSNFFVFNSPARIMLTHYEVLKSEKDRFLIFLKTRDVAAILDESAKIKNPDSEITKVFFLLSKLFKRRVIMTGTPMANRPFDLWAQIKFLDGGKSLGEDFDVFKRKNNLTNDLFLDDQKKDDFEKSLSGLQKKISDFSVRETKSSGVIKLPEKKYENIIVDWETVQYELYQKIREDLRAIIVKEGIPKEDSSEDVLKRLLRLVQIASNPKLIDDSYRAEPGKIPYLVDLLEKIKISREKTIVWTTFTENADWLCGRLKAFGSCKIHGKLSMETRNKSIDQFMNNPEVTVLVATPGAAKEGLTLTVANHAIFYDRSFSLDDYLQAQDRIHRISQVKTCFIYNLIMSDSVDVWIDKLLNAKQLAAGLGQGDIRLEDYQTQISYDFGELIKSILNKTKRSH